jgi:endoglucanase
MVKRFPATIGAVLRWLAFSFALATAVAACGGGSSGSGGSTPPPAGNAGEMRDLTSVQLSQLMSPGINLGNTLEAIGGETAWGNPMTTQADEQLKAAGQSVHPVAYSQYADANHNISPMDGAVKQVSTTRAMGLYAMIASLTAGG